jgi:SpoIVB peptidase S55
MLRHVVPAVFALAAALSAQTTFFPLKDIKAGMRGTGRTVFSGNKIEDFQVEILGVLENIGPKESLILARLSGGPLEHTGVMQGMSGSPVYIDGKLAGAVAMAFPFAKDPIAGIRPIEAMMRTATSPSPTPSSPPAAQRASLFDRDLTRAFSKPAAALTGEARMVDIATPISFGGFSRATLEAFGPQLRALGLEPRQGVTSGGKLVPAMGNPADLKPGSMISVQLMSGDLTVGADGTVTHIDGNRVYAFGHRFLDIGSTALPFARAEVLTLLANTNTSFKLSTAKEWMGTIYQDRNAAVAGELGKRPALVPMTIQVTNAGKTVETYQMNMVNDPLLSPLLMQMAVFSAIDETERTVGASSVRLTGAAEFANGPAPIQFNNLLAGDNGSAMMASVSAAMPVAFVMQGGFESLQLKRVTLNLEAFDHKKQLTIDGVSAARREVRAGEKVLLHISLTGDNGAEVVRQVEYQVPAGAQPGPLYFTVSDATSANVADYRQVLAASMRTPEQLLAVVNNLHPNNKAYVRVWRADPAFQLEGADLPDPPASVALILANSQAGAAGITQNRNSKVAQFEIDAGDMAVTGNKTIQVEVKE